MKRLLFLLALLPSLAFGQVLEAPTPSWLTLWTESGGTLTLSGNLVATNVSATSFTATAASGVDAFVFAQGAGIKSGSATLKSLGSTWSTDYFQLTNIGYSSTLNVLSGSADAADAVLMKILTSANTMTTPGAKLLTLAPNPANDVVAYVDKDGAYGMDGTDESGTPGAATINKAAGRVGVAAAAQTLVVTNSLVTTDTMIGHNVETIDATCTYARITPGAGSFTITMDAACTGTTNVVWWLHPMF
jgi:hypothetical protein